MLISLLSSALAFAAILTGQGPSQPYEGVNLPPKANLEVDGRRTALEAVGHGLRYKKVAFIKAHVYVGALYAADAKTVARSKEKILASLDAEPAVAMQMTFLRNVDAPKIQEAFREGFEENKVSPDKAPVRKFLEAVKAGGSVSEGKTLTVAAERIGAKEIVTFEGADGRPVTIEGPAGFRRDIFSLWFGKPTDGGVESLQEEILGK